MKDKAIEIFATFLILVVVSFVVFAHEALSLSQKIFLWRVQSKTNTVYILGSLHYSKKEIYPLSEKIEKAFDESEILVVEANVHEMKKTNIQGFMERAFYPEKDTLENHVSPEIYERVVKEASELGIPSELLKKQRPWFLALSLVAFESLRSGFDPNLGMDRYFLSKAEGGKRILELESLDDQFSLLSGFSDEDPERFLLYTLKDLKMFDQELAKLTQAWTSGDAKAMEPILTKSVLEDRRLSSISEKVIYERNRKMVSRIEDY